MRVGVGIELNWMMVFASIFVILLTIDLLLCKFDEHIVISPGNWILIDTIAKLFVI